MTLQQFIDYALNKKQIEFHSYDPRAKFQCVDLANDYITKVWGLEAIIGTNAKDFPERLKPGMEFVKNTTEYLPNPGEIAIWNGRVGGGAGHIAVVIKKGKQTTFESLDQNWSKPLHITLETHSYTNIRGFIRKKESMSKELEACLADREKFWRERDELDKKLGREMHEHKKTVIRLDEAQEKIKELEEVEASLVEQLDSKEKSLAGVRGEVTKKETKIAELEAQIKDLQTAKPTITDRLTSRKWIASFSGILVLLLSKFFQIELDPTEVTLVLTPIIGFITAEGVTDFKQRMMAQESLATTQSPVVKKD